MTSCVLLCAGKSLRFGSPKALCDLGGETIIARLQKTLLASRIDEIIIVSGAVIDDMEPHILKHKKVKVVHNKDYNLGQTSSFKAGLKAVSPDTKRILLLPVDFPLIQTATLDILVDYCVKENPLILIPTHEGRKGHPPVFHVKLKEEFSVLDDTQGINTIARQHKNETRLLSVEDPGVLLTFNTREEFERLNGLL